MPVTDVQTRKSEILDEKFSFPHLKPNVANNRWYANKSFTDVTYDDDHVMMETFACPKITEENFSVSDQT